MEKKKLERVDPELVKLSQTHVTFGQEPIQELSPDTLVPIHQDHLHS